jgi:peptidoglycan glycosyltransferase
MKAPILRLYGTVVLLFAVLIGFTSYWSVFDAEALRNEPLNHRDELQEQRIPRGAIRTTDGQVIAASAKRADKTYRRRYPQGELFGHPVGYSFANLGSSGLEAEYNDRLTDRHSELVTVFDSLLGRKREGQDLETTLDADVQRVAASGLSSTPSGKGAVVAMDVRTGAVRAMVSAPGFDPNNLDDKKTFSRLSTDAESTPLVNRATQSRFPPGSTMKAVTAAAALDSGEYTPDSSISGKNGKVISGVPLQNFGGEDFGSITLTFALTNSVNTVFGEIGEKLGKSTMKDYMERFGFDALPPIDLPESQLTASGERLPNGKLIKPTNDAVDVGRMAIGQDKLVVTPLQMASVAQTIGNGGVRMKPYLVAKSFDADGRTQLDRDPDEAERVMSEESAAALTGMMQQVVKEGTGTAAALSGVDLAGKTGTAELNNNGLNDLWFIGFTDRHAVAVMVERVQGGTGGTVAAPIAKAVLEELGD